MAEPAVGPVPTVASGPVRGTGPGTWPDRPCPVRQKRMTPAPRAFEALRRCERDTCPLRTCPGDRPQDMAGAAMSVSPPSFPDLSGGQALGHGRNGHVRSGKRASGLARGPPRRAGAAGGRPVRFGPVQGTGPRTWPERPCPSRRYAAAGAAFAVLRNIRDALVTLDWHRDRVVSAMPDSLRHRTVAAGFQELRSRSSWSGPKGRDRSSSGWSRTSRTLRTSVAGVNGLLRNAPPRSVTPRRPIASSL
jgi:hypothetical protein